MNPSSDDLALTVRLKAAGTTMGIKVLDHVILGLHPDTQKPQHLSLVDSGQWAGL